MQNAPLPLALRKPPTGWTLTRRSCRRGRYSLKVGLVKAADCEQGLSLTQYRAVELCGERRRTVIRHNNAAE